MAEKDRRNPVRTEDFGYYRPRRMRITVPAMRAVRQNVLAWLICCVWLPLIMLAMLVTLRRYRDTLGTRMVRQWGFMLLWVAGVRLALDPDVTAELAVRRGRVLTFNHSSTLDLLVGAALTPEGGVTVVKREMLRLPLIGQAVQLLDMLPIDRADRGSAAAAFQVAARRMRNERLSVLIAPEGTRSKTGALGPFKLGAFHLAMQGDVPIVPLVLHGCAALMPSGRLSCQAGVVRISLLPEVPAATWSPATMRAEADELRSRYGAALQPAVG
ncbi:MAG: 1-acyl-sn-glycerol-3-phosphate acyltransferase [Myxococcales bacterium]|nr:1-acyl-sn-glycerol-3-phosphate acyltransferase [Myxococcales bacterium]